MVLVAVGFFRAGVAPDPAPPLTLLNPPLGFVVVDDDIFILSNRSVHLFQKSIQALLEMDVIKWPGLELCDVSD